MGPLLSLIADILMCESRGQERDMAGVLLVQMEMYGRPRKSIAEETCVQTSLQTRWEPLPITVGMCECVGWGWGDGHEKERKRDRDRLELQAFWHHHEYFIPISSDRCVPSCIKLSEGQKCCEYSYLKLQQVAQYTQLGLGAALPMVTTSQQKWKKK